jgi:hypothetical protein
MGIRTGRLMDLQAQAHNTLLAALANSVGVPMNGWGDPRFPGVLTMT